MLIGYLEANVEDGFSGDRAKVFLTAGFVQVEDGTVDVVFCPE